MKYNKKNVLLNNNFGINYFIDLVVDLFKVGDIFFFRLNF